MGQKFDVSGHLYSHCHNWVAVETDELWQVLCSCSKVQNSRLFRIPRSLCDGYILVHRQ